MQGFILPSLRRPQSSDESTRAQRFSSSITVPAKLPPVHGAAESQIESGHRPSSSPQVALQKGSSNAAVTSLPHLKTKLATLLTEAEGAYNWKLINRLALVEQSNRAIVEGEEVECLTDIRDAFIGERLTYLRRRLLAAEKACRLTLEQQQGRGWLFLVRFAALEEEEHDKRANIQVHEGEERCVSWPLMQSKLWRDELRVLSHPLLSRLKGSRPATASGDSHRSSPVPPDGLDGSNSNRDHDDWSIRPIVEAFSEHLYPGHALHDDCATSYHAVASDSRQQAVAKAVHHRQFVDGVNKATYHRDFVVLDPVSLDVAHVPAKSLPYTLPGLIMPWEFVLDERDSRLAISHIEAQCYCELVALKQIVQLVVHTEQRSWKRLMAVHHWVDEGRLHQVLLLQRWWRFQSLVSMRTRRLQHLRTHLKTTAGAMRRRELTAEVVSRQVEAVEDSTLRDVWAEDFATGEQGLFYAFRKQLLEVGMEATYKRAFRQFVSSLRNSIAVFIRKSFQFAARAIKVMFQDEKEHRMHLLNEERRTWNAVLKMIKEFHVMFLEDRTEDDVAAVLIHEDATKWRFGRYELQFKQMIIHCNHLYDCNKSREEKRVQVCYYGWRQFRVDDTRYIVELDDLEGYVLATQGRVSSASGKRPAQPRIPSGGYQRVGSAGYQRLGSAGHERLGSAGYPRLGSAGASSPNRSNRIGSAGGSSTRIGSAGRKVAEPIARRPKRLCRFWEGHEYVIENKKRIASEEQERRQQLAHQYAHFAHYTAVFQFLLQSAPHLFVGVDGCLPPLVQSMTALQLQEDVERLNTVEMESNGWERIVAEESVEKSSRTLLQTPTLGQIIGEESSRRTSLEHEEGCHRKSVIALAKKWESTFSFATENLRRMGLVPREPNARSCKRVPSALHHDKYYLKRKNFTSVAAVALVVQKWWRKVSRGRYDMQDAGVEVLKQHHSNQAHERSLMATSSVIQDQLRALSEDQWITRRIASAGPRGASSRPPSTQFQSRPVSAMSNTQKALNRLALVSMRTVISRRMTQCNFFTSWTLTATEEQACRSDWEQMEVLSRKRLHKYFVDEIVTRLFVGPKLARIELKLEPANRLRVEREGLHSFLALFFTPAANAIRWQHVYDKELASRQQILQSEELACHEIAVGLMSLRSAYSTWTSITSRSSLESREQGASRDDESTIWTTRATNTNCRLGSMQLKALRRAESQRALPLPARREGVAVIVEREGLHRHTTVLQYQLELFGCVSRSMQEAHQTQCELYLQEWERMWRVHAVEFDLGTCPRRPLPVAQLLLLGHDETVARRESSQIPNVNGYADVFVAAHENFGATLWRQAIQRWRMQLSQQAYFCMTDVSEALVSRLARVGTKPQEMDIIEAGGRQMVSATEELERTALLEKIATMRWYRRY